MDIKIKVAEKINGCRETVINTVVDKLAEIEINKRVLIIQQAIAKQELLQKELAKINGKCDSVFYDKDGIKHESMSEKRFNDIKKSKESLELLEKVLNSALETNTQESYNKLNGLLGGNKQEGSAEAKSES
jgi:hypothetical protein